MVTKQLHNMYTYEITKTTILPDEKYANYIFNLLLDGIIVLRDREASGVLIAKKEEVFEELTSNLKIDE